MPIAPARPSSSPHVIVVGNEKGGSGKTTIAMHLAVALLEAGQRVATFDLDSHQKSLTHYIDNRRAFARRFDKRLRLPSHFCVARGERSRIDENEAIEFAGLERAVLAVEQDHDFVIIDTPPHDSYLMRLAHSMGDTLISPLNDSFLDLDVLATIDPISLHVVRASHYGEMVREVRRYRRTVDNGTTSWIVVRNRLTTLRSRNHKLIGDCLDELSSELGFRFLDGLAERVVYRDLFPRGLTVLDAPGDVHGEIGPSRDIARREVEALVQALRLPIDADGRRRAATRAEWFVANSAPLEMDDIVSVQDGAPPHAANRSR